MSLEWCFLVICLVFVAVSVISTFIGIGIGIVLTYVIEKSILYKDGNDNDRSSSIVE